MPLSTIIRTVGCMILAASALQTANAWTVREDFNSGTAGSAVKSPSIEWLAQSKYTSSHYGDSGLGAQLGITGGTSGSSDFGAYIYFPQPVKEGGEIWYRVRTNMPNSFDYRSSTFALKFMRVHTANGTSNRGYMDTYISPDGSYLYQNEFYQDQAHESFQSQNLSVLGLLSSSMVVSKNTWETYEVYVKFSATAGKGIYRVWKNGKLYYENTKWPTLASSADQSDYALLFTYWNGNAPQSQALFVDDLIVTNEKPANKDSVGNAYIGAGAQAPMPMAPSSVIVQ